ncbi:unnamed protein product, partial [Rotaria magnacalcarata]
MKGKDRARKKLARSKMSSSQLRQLCLRQNLNLRKFREKVQVNLTQPPSQSSFPTKQAKAKALKKVTTVLPINKEKQTELIQQIAADLKSLTIDNKYARVQQSLSTDIKQKINDYYYRDDISYQAPGKRDTITVKENGIKQQLQKRYLLYSLRELHQLFLEENPDIKIGRSLFQDLRPSNVLYKSSTPHNTCVCLYHENIDLLLKSLKNHIHNFNSINLHSFIKLLVCDENKELCMFSHCDQCSLHFNNKIRDQMIHPTSVIKWTLWSTPQEGRAMKVDHEGLVLNCVEALASRVKYFLFHVFVKREQSKFFELIKQNVNDQSCLMQVDYSENFALVEQNEIQSVHWSRKQISLFTTYIWSQSNNYPFVIVSDDPSHDKYTVSKCLEQIFTRLKLLLPSLNKLVIFSDGSASQFKQRYLFKNLTILAKRFSIGLSWNFFASSHGK